MAEDKNKMTLDEEVALLNEIVDEIIIDETLERLLLEEPFGEPLPGPRERFYDASAIVLLAFPTSDPMAFKALVNRLRPYTVKALEAAGYCCCGAPIVKGLRCPSCSTIH